MTRLGHSIVATFSALTLSGCITAPQSGGFGLGGGSSMPPIGQYQAVTQGLNGRIALDLNGYFSGVVQSFQQMASREIEHIELCQRAPLYVLESASCSDAAQSSNTQRIGTFANGNVYLSGVPLVCSPGGHILFQDPNTRATIHGMKQDCQVDNEQVKRTGIRWGMK